ncbi:MAG TPA: hypothetical protein VF112_07315 [Candidatus Dormibacteraeota bacterium]
MSIGGRDEAERARRWEELMRSSRAVRALPAGDDPDAQDEPGARHRAVAASLVAATAVGSAAVGVFARGPLSVAAASGLGYEGQLLQLTNGDRTSNGVAALTANGTLQSIADNLPFGCSGGVAHGRTQDMIDRNYFDHPIPECGGQYADIMLTPNGIRWTKWGENIAWEVNGGSEGNVCDPSTPVPVLINCIYWNSPEHKANILDPAFNQFGTAFDLAASYQGASNAWVNTEEFIQGGGGIPAPTPVPVRTPRPVPPPVHVPAPVTIPQVQTPPPAAPTPAPTPTPTPVPTPTPFAPASLAPTDGSASTPQPATVPPTPLLYTPQGLLSDSVEAVLEGSLLD